MRQLTELLAQLVATQVGLYQSSEESQYDLLRRLQDQGILPREIAQLFGEVRRARQRREPRHGELPSHCPGHTQDYLAARALVPPYLQEPVVQVRPLHPPQAPQDESADLRAELTHKQLRELALELDKAGFSEASSPLPGAR